MKLLRRFVALAATAGMLTMGFWAGAQNTGPTNSTPHPGRRAGMLPVEQQLQHLSTRLDLTEEQKPKVLVVLEKQSKQMRAVNTDTSLSREARMSEIRSIQEETTRELKAILTPEQFKKYQSLFQPRGARRGPSVGPAGNASTNAPAAR